jgi:hypothetical protein
MSTIAKLDTNNMIAARLDQHAEQLERNKSLPWLGLGLHKDLRAASAALRGQTLPVPEKIATKIMEFDL